MDTPEVSDSAELNEAALEAIADRARRLFLNTVYSGKNVYETDLIGASHPSASRELRQIDG